MGFQCQIQRQPRTSKTLTMTDSVCCHLDDRRGLFVRRDFSSLTRRNDSADAAFCHFHIAPNIFFGLQLSLTVTRSAVEVYADTQFIDINFTLFKIGSILISQ